MMSMDEIMVIVFLVLLLGGTAVYQIRKKKQGATCGGCSGCAPGKSCIMIEEKLDKLKR